MRTILVAIASAALLSGCGEQGGGQGTSGASSESVGSANQPDVRGQPASQSNTGAQQSVDIYTDQKSRAGTTGADTQAGAQGDSSSRSTTGSHGSSGGGLP